MAGRASGRVSRVGAVAACGLVGLVALVGWYAYLRERTPTVPVPTVTLPDPNGYDVLADASATLALPRIVVGRTPNLDTCDLGDVGQLLADKRRAGRAGAAAFARARQALELPFGYPLERPRRANLGQMLRRMLVCEAHVRAADGDWRGATESVVDVLRLAAKLQHGAAGVAIGAERQADEVLLSLLPRCDAATARWAAAELCAIDAARRPYAESLRRQRDDLCLTWPKRLASPHWRDENLILPATVGHHFPMHQRTLAERVFRVRAALVTKQQYVDEWLHYFDEALVRAEEPWDPRRRPVPLPVSDYGREARGTYEGNRIDWTTTCAGTRLLAYGLALRAWRLEHGGEAPARPGALVPDYLPALPADPFCGERLLVYAPSLRLGAYSRGPDADDDGGRALPLRRTTTTGPFSIVHDGDGDFVLGANR